MSYFFALKDFQGVNFALQKITSDIKSNGE